MRPHFAQVWLGASDYALMRSLALAARETGFSPPACEEAMDHYAEGSPFFPDMAQDRKAESLQHFARLMGWTRGAMSNLEELDGVASPF